MGFWFIKQAFEKKKQLYIILQIFIYRKGLSDGSCKFRHCGLLLLGTYLFFVSSAVIKTASSTSEQKKIDNIRGLKPFSWV